MKKKLFFLVISLITCGITFPLIATRANDKTAIVQEKGHIYTCFTYWHYSSGQFWNSKGKRTDAYNTFSKNLYEGYAEYGLTWQDTISLKSGWGRIEESINGRTFGFTDLQIGWKRYIGEKWGAVISGEAILFVPIESKHASGLRYGNYGGEFNLLMSDGFYFTNRPAAYDIRFGFRTFDKGPCDQILSDIIGRFMIFSRLCVLAGFRLEYGLLNGNSDIRQSYFCFYPNFRLLTARVELMFTIYKGASAFLGYHKRVWGRNIGTGGEMYAGAQIQF